VNSGNYNLSSLMGGDPSWPKGGVGDKTVWVGGALSREGQMVDGALYWSEQKRR